MRGLHDSSSRRPIAPRVIAGAGLDQPECSQTAIERAARHTQQSRRFATVAVGARERLNRLAAFGVRRGGN